MHDITYHVLMEDRLRRLRDLQDPPKRRTRPVQRTQPPTNRRYQRRR